MTFSPSTLSLLVVVALALDVLALALVAMATRRRRPASTGPLPVDADLRGVLEGQALTLQRLDAAVRRLAAEDAALAESFTGAVQRVALVRYDAFDDVGGRLSFSCAMLDGQGNGVVVTSINGRQDTRVYAKPVYGGASEHNLSEEEQEAIREALASPRQTVEAR